MDTADRLKVNHGSNATPDNFAALIESRPFLRECICRSMQSAFSVPLVTFSTLSELGDQPRGASAALVILSLIEASKEAWATALKDLSGAVSRGPVGGRSHQPRNLSRERDQEWQVEQGHRIRPEYV